jgi:formamidopyrimidine-DNA glycosylase
VPELPEVETVARDLRSLIVGASIVGARCTWARTLRTHEPEAFGAALAGRRVETVGRRAKLLVIGLDGGSALTVHLKMTGQLFVTPVGAPVDPYVRLVLELADGRELRFRDIRKFGRVGLYARDGATGELVTEPGGAAVFAGHGPEPLEDDFTLRAFRTLIRSRRGRLKPLLLDQAFLAGIGNIYADEALWAARLHPIRSASSLHPADERRLYTAMRTVLSEAVERRGSSIDDYTAPEGDGQMQDHLNVYQRTGEPCLRCGRAIRRVVIGARASHFCSWCQRLPAADRAGATRILATMRGAAERGRDRRPGSHRASRWTELAGEGTVGLTPAESARATSRARTDRTKRAAASRRAATRAAMAAPPTPTTATPDPSPSPPTTAGRAPR